MMWICFKAGGNLKGLNEHGIDKDEHGIDKDEHCVPLDPPAYLYRTITVFSNYLFTYCIYQNLCVAFIITSDNNF